MSFPSLSSLGIELLQVLRGLRKERSFSSTVILTVALCLAANVVIFTVVRSVLLRPLPYREPERLVTIRNQYAKMNSLEIECSVTNYYEYKEAIPAFEETGLCGLRQSTIYGEPASSTRIASLDSLPSFFSVLGVKPALGRFFTEEENAWGHNNVAVISHSFWKAQFGASPDVLGRKIRLDSVPVEIIGVMPASFRYLSSDIQVFRPMPIDPQRKQVSQRHNNLSYDLIARLKPGCTIEEAQQQLDAYNQNLLKNDPNAQWIINAGFSAHVLGLHANHVAKVRSSLYMLQGAAVLLLLIGVVNLTNLFLVRATARAREHALREMLGASQVHLSVRIFSETLLLCLLGALLGVAFGALLLKALPLVGADRLPLMQECSLDFEVISVCFATAVATGALLSLPLMALGLRGGIAPALGASSRSHTGSRSLMRLRQSLIIGQVALVFILLAGAGLLAVSLKNVMSINPGFRPEKTLAAYYGLPWSDYSKGELRLGFAERLLSAMREIPGTAKAGITSCLPLDSRTNTDSVKIVGYVAAPGQPIPNHYFTFVAGDYFEAIGMNLVEGRFLNDSDSRSTTRSCVIDEDVARTYWPGKSAVGQQIDRSFKESGIIYSIVGVVSRVKQRNLTDLNRGMIYLPLRSDSYPTAGFAVLRTLQPPQLAGGLLRDAVRKADPAVPIDELRTMENRVDDSLKERRAPVILSSAFALMALGLAALGVYGVLAYAVTQRRREIGVRMALGAQPRQVLGQFLGMGLRFIVYGTALGLVGTLLLGQTLRSLLYGVSPLNLGVIGLAALALALIILAASFIPSRRASLTEPVEALRSE
jgi:predicted permease